MRPGWRWLVRASALLLAILWQFPQAANGQALQIVKPASTGQVWAVVVEGIIKDSEDKKLKDGALDLLSPLLDAATKTNATQKVILANRGPAGKPSEESTAANVEQAMKAMAASVKPGDTFLFFFTGQANTVASSLRLNLPGPDFTDTQLADWLAAIHAGTIVVVLDCPAAGAATKCLIAPGRILVCGARSDQPYSTRFGAIFAAALGDSESDTDHDGRISILEAFALAAKRVDEWYEKAKLLRTETPLLEDDGDGVPSQEPWRKDDTKHDGAVAAKTFLN